MKDQHRIRAYGCLGLGLCLLVGAGIGLFATPLGDRPQVNNADLFSLLLGDARQLMSDAIVAKAEVYFHGGLEVECDHRGGEADHDDHPHDAHGEAPPAASSFSWKNPWRTMTQTIHAQEHIHLSDTGSAELLPLYWAACRVAPKNIEAYENAAYVLSSNLKRPDEGLKLLDEGIRNNPTTYRLDFYKGQIALGALHDFARAAQFFSSAWNKSIASKEESVAQDQPRLCFYLGYLALQRGDRAEAQQWLARAQQINAASASTRDLAKLLEKQ